LNCLLVPLGCRFLAISYSVVPDIVLGRVSIGSPFFPLGFFLELLGSVGLRPPIHRAAVREGHSPGNHFVDRKDHFEVLPLPATGWQSVYLFLDSDPYSS